MSFWSALGEHAGSAHTPFVVLAFFIVRRLAARVPKLERYHLRAIATLLLGHVVALSIGAAQRAYGYDSSVAQTTSFAFGTGRWSR